MLSNAELATAIAVAETMVKTTGTGSAVYEDTAEHFLTLLFEQRRRAEERPAPALLRAEGYSFGLPGIHTIKE